MPFAQETLTQELPILGVLPPQSLAAGTDTSITGLDLSKVRRIIFIVSVGSVGGGPGTVDFKLQSCATAGGTYADISGAAITTINASNKVAAVEIRADQLAAGQRYIRHSLTVGTNAVLVSVVALGGDAPAKPATGQDVAAVAQRVVL